MLPTYIQQEVMRRLSPQRLRTLAKGLGIDPDQPLPEANPQFHERREFSGNLQFDLTIGALGHCTSVPCRLYWTADLTDDVDRETGKPIRVLGHLQQSLRALIATHEYNPMFEWAPISTRILPPAALSHLDDQVEELARMLEQSRR